jgi:hypothetical protein
MRAFPAQIAVRLVKFRAVLMGIEQTSGSRKYSRSFNIWWDAPESSTAGTFSKPVRRHCAVVMAAKAGT